MIFVFSFFKVKNVANEIGPTRPKYIVAEMITLPQTFSEEVKFLDSPTVAVALTVSKTTSRAGASVDSESNIVERATMMKDENATAIAFLEARVERFLLNKVTSFLPRTVAIVVAIKTTMVTVLIPPAVPTGEPPINIKIRQMIDDAFVRFSCGRVEKPAVLVVIDWKNAICILSKKLWFFSVKGLLYSQARIDMPPIKIKAKVETSTILLCKVSLLTHLNLVCLTSFNTRIISHHTMNPKPPRIISIQVTMLTRGLVA